VLGTLSRSSRGELQAAPRSQAQVAEKTISTDRRPSGTWNMLPGNQALGPLRLQWFQRASTKRAARSSVLSACWSAEESGQTFQRIPMHGHQPEARNCSVVPFSPTSHRDVHTGLVSFLGRTNQAFAWVSGGGQEIDGLRADPASDFASSFHRGTIRSCHALGAVLRSGCCSTAESDRRFRRHLAVGFVFTQFSRQDVPEGISVDGERLKLASLCQ